MNCPKCNNSMLWLKRCPVCGYQVSESESDIYCLYCGSVLFDHLSPEERASLPLKVQCPFCGRHTPVNI